MASNEGKKIGEALLTRSDDDEMIIEAKDVPKGELVLLDDPDEETPVLVVVRENSPEGSDCEDPHQQAEESSDVPMEEEEEEETNDRDEPEHEEDEDDVDEEENQDNDDDEKLDEQEEALEEKDEQETNAEPHPSTSADAEIKVSLKKKRGRPKKTVTGEKPEKQSAKKARKSEMDSAEIRRSARERLVKKYSEFGDFDDEDLDEGDGLTAAQRAHLDRRLKKIGTTKTWRKQIKIIYGETAKRNKYVDHVKVIPVAIIDQSPSKPPVAIKKCYIPLEPPTFIATENCQFLFRPQDTFGVDMANKGGCDFTCEKCQFTSTRINNMVHHHLKDCVFNKDFFSWTDDTFSEATKKKKPVKKNQTEPQRTELDSEGEEPQTSSQAGTSNPSAGEQPSAASRSDEALSSSDDDDQEEEEDESLFKKVGFKKHDIVWVGHTGKVHWPGLVLKITSRGQLSKARTNTIEVRVLFIHNGEKVNVPIGKIEGFDSSRRQSFLEEGQKQKPNLATEHARAAQKADKFLRERVLGMNIDPVRFFRLGETKVIQEHETSSSEDDDVPDESQSGPQWELSLAEDLPPGETKTNSKIIELSKRSKRRRKVTNAALVDFIVKGKVDPHLVGIYRGTVPSERNEQFTSGNETLREKLRQSPWWGPIDDQQQQETIYEYCHELIQRSCEEAQELDTIKYAFEVFSPEAITKAISKLAIVDMEKAADIFLQGAEIIRKCEEQQKEASHQMERDPDEGEDDSIAENLDTGEVVREELERMGVETDLLEEIDQ